MDILVCEKRMGGIVASLRVYPDRGILMLTALDPQYHGTIMEHITVMMDYNEACGLYRNIDIWLQDYITEIWETTYKHHRMMRMVDDTVDNIPF